MPRLVFLGTANAVADEHHENTHLLVQGRERTILVDCANNPLIRLKKVGVDFNDLTDLVLTHFHPDHVSGVPMLLMTMWLQGRQRPLHVYGLHHTIDRMENVMAAFDWGHWPNFFPMAFHRLPKEEMTPLLETSEIRIFSSPVRHLLPTIGLRVEFPQTGKVMAYSCDTEPCSQVLRLAKDADLLIHEVTGPSAGHSSASEVANIAREANVRALYLAHYPVGDYDAYQLVEETQRDFKGDVFLAKDFMEIAF
jgi:ribonuclease Z